MNKKLAVSIVIPVYNEARQLEACLRAIAAQTVTPLEVLVVDNNSSDGSALVARHFDFVRVLREPRQGIQRARTRGFDAARGEILARIDADTLLPADWVARISRFYNEPAKHGFAFTGGADFYNVRLPRAVAWLYNLLAFEFNRLLIGHPTLWGSNMAITRRQWHAVRGQLCDRSGIHEDLDLAIHLRQAGFGIRYDRTCRVGAEMRRVRSNRHELWDYLQWWPRTLRLHRKWAWPLCWLFGALLLYLITPLLNVAEYVARFVGYRALPQLSRDRV